MTQIDTSFPRFALYFRRYAPFAKFGSLAGIGGVFEGDNRGPSTSEKAKSRTYGCVIFNRFGIIHSFANSSGTILYSPNFMSPGGQVVTGLSNVKHAVVRSTAHGPYLFGFKASTAGSVPLIPGSPDINTFIDVEIDFGRPSILQIKGEAFGDNFPNLEVFLQSSGSHAAMLLDGRTTGGAHTGPPTRLFGSHEQFSLGRFFPTLALNPKGELAASTSVAPTKLREYPENRKAESVWRGRQQ